VRQACAGGLDLVDLLVGFEKAYIVDALAGGGRAGEIYRLTPESLPLPERLGATHGRQLGLPMPREIVIYAVEINQGYDFGEELSPPVKEAAEEIVRQLLEELTRELSA